MPSEPAVQIPVLPHPTTHTTPSWLLILVMVIVIGPLIALSQIIAYWRTDVVDDQMFGYFGWRIAHGATVYLDVWDNKPPGIYWINALGFLIGRDSYFGVVALCVAALVVSHAAFYVAACCVYQRGAAALTTILLSFYLTHAYYTGGTNRTETFLTACELTAVAIYLRGLSADRWWKWYSAGLLCGLAFLFKQVGLAAWICMGLHTIALMALRHLPARTGLKRCLLLIGGAATTVGIAVVALAGQGALREACFATFGFNRMYFAAQVSRFPYNYVTWTLLKEHVKPILVLPLLMSAAAVIHAFLWWLRPQYRPPEIQSTLRAGLSDCLLFMFLFTAWFLAALYGALLSPHGFRHYMVPSIPPMMLLAGYLINVLRGESTLLRQFQRRAWVLVAFIIMGYFALEAVRLQFQEVAKVWVPRIDPRLTGTGHYQPAEWEVIGDAVAELTRPGDRIQCWGYLPGVYLRARRLNATRYATMEKVGQLGRLARFIVDEVEQKLRADPPAALVISSGDYSWMRQGDRLGRKSDFNLGPWIEEHYCLAREIPRFGTYYVFKRRDLMRAGPCTQPALEAVPARHGPTARQM